PEALRRDAAARMAEARPARRGRGDARSRRGAGVVGPGRSAGPARRLSRLCRRPGARQLVLHLEVRRHGAPVPMLLPRARPAREAGGMSGAVLEPGWRERLLLSRRAAPAVLEPFPYFVVDDYLPPALYEAARASFPVGVETDQYGNRKQVFSQHRHPD